MDGDDVPQTAAGGGWTVRRAPLAPRRNSAPVAPTLTRATSSAENERRKEVGSGIQVRRDHEHGLA